MAEKRLRKELDELVKEGGPILSVEPVNDLFTWDVAFEVTAQATVYYFRVEFPTDYPFKPPKISPLTQTGDKRCHLDLDVEKWGPALTVRKLFETVVAPAFDETKEDSIFEHLAPMLRQGETTLAYVGIGCGGPSLQQQLPLDVVLRTEHDVALILVDRYLLPDQPLRQWHIEHSGTCSLYACNAFLTETDVEPLKKLLSDNFDRVVLGDHRGDSFGGAPYPLGKNIAPRPIFADSYAARLPGTDDATRLVLQVLHGITDPASSDADLLKRCACASSAHTDWWFSKYSSIYGVSYSPFNKPLPSRCSPFTKDQLNRLQTLDRAVGSTATRMRRPNDLSPLSQLKQRPAADVRRVTKKSDDASSGK